MAGNHLGFWSSVTLVGIGAGYVLALGAGFARHGLREPIADPNLAIMEVLTLASAPAIVMLLAAVHDRATPERKVYGLIALAFGTLFAGTSVVHFVELTAARQLEGGGIVWPSRVYAAELLAWDVFLGLALTCAALVFTGGERERTVRRGLLACGALCLAGAIGPVVGNMRLQLIGVLAMPACSQSSPSGWRGSSRRQLHRTRGPPTDASGSRRRASPVAESGRAAAPACAFPLDDRSITMQISPYLSFKGDCEAAFTFYARCLGLPTRGDLPLRRVTLGGSGAGRLVGHGDARQPEGRHRLLQGADVAPDRYEEPKGFSLSLQMKDTADAERIFHDLATYGRVTMPLAKTFWAARFGMVVDRFGIPWLINCEGAAEH